MNRRKEAGIIYRGQSFRIRRIWQVVYRWEYPFIFVCNVKGVSAEAPLILHQVHTTVGFMLWIEVNGSVSYLNLRKKLIQLQTP